MSGLSAEIKARWQMVSDAVLPAVVIQHAPRGWRITKEVIWVIRQLALLCGCIGAAYFCGKYLRLNDQALIDRFQLDPSGRTLLEGRTAFVGILVVATAFAVLLAAALRRWWKSNLADTAIVRGLVAVLKLTGQTVLWVVALVSGAVATWAATWGVISAGIWSEDGAVLLGGLFLVLLGGGGIVDLVLKSRTAWLKMRAAA